ncbi:hypothetical protein PAAG_06307 [Paracoccidioides lutzii Pb01]|uniref:Uncharacterized protein n=1 Tax=Paracoccidioides lutzii (strain ATCC MYA-826 / Pb01) TaxID=502779 RepID=C1H6B6_PARBA|nr:hypothetical protein PAAG_06307 [Paracoccidioides lutzii Pb01]EEH35260.2 hypothetical protein PAAG_06307 [Paracoccidioides lutzii Pb01]
MSPPFRLHSGLTLDDRPNLLTEEQTAMLVTFQAAVNSPANRQNSAQRKDNLRKSLLTPMRDPATSFFRHSADELDSRAKSFLVNPAELPALN